MSEREDFKQLERDLGRVLDADTDSLRELCQLAALDPAEDFEGADLRGLSLRGQDLTGFSFRGCDLRGADFREVRHLDSLALDGARTEGMLQPPRMDPTTKPMAVEHRTRVPSVYGTMTEARMAAKLAAKCDLSGAKAAEIIDAIFSTKPGQGIIAIELDAGREVSIAGFGKFETRNRAARAGRNPATGATIRIAATKVAAFRAAKQLKARVSD